MDFKPGSRHWGTRFTAIGLLAGILIVPGTGTADTIFTVNGTPVDSGVVDLYFNSRLGNQRGQATPEQREALMGELRDIYILATQPDAATLAKDPAVAAQMDLQKHSILAQAVASAFFKTIDVTEEEMLAAYDEQVKLAPPLQYKARHILVPTQGEAVELIKQLDDGANFEELAKEKSTGPSGPNGGDLGWFSPNQMVEPFSKAVEALENGAYTSAPVQTQFGWHVILREDSRKSEPPTFESAKENIRAAVQQQKFQDHLDELRAAAKE